MSLKDKDLEQIAYLARINIEKSKFPSLKEELESILKYKLIPVEAKAGSLIVFDSDTLHRGGIIKKDNLERLIIRLHCYKI